MKPATPVQTKREAPTLAMVVKVLLICGILSSLLYIGTDMPATMRWEGYSYTSQSISELMAIEAPTRPFMVPLFAAYSVLVIAFGLGVWGSAGQRRGLRFTAILLVAYAAADLMGLLFFPMHLRGPQAMTATDIMHIVVTSLIVLCTLLFIGFGAAANGKGFRLYSIGTSV